MSRYVRMTPAKEAQIVKLLHDPEISMVTIARRLVVSTSAVYQINLRTKVRPVKPKEAK